MKTITFYSYKGGVGRSLTLANIAFRLADLGKTVCIVDFDLEAPGLHLKFGEYLKGSDLSKGIVDYISGFQNDSILPNSIKDFTTNINYNAVLNGSIKLIPAGANLDRAEYWRTLASISWRDLFYSQQNYGIKLLIHLKELIKQDLNPDFILIDSRTGITDVSGISMTLLADSVVLLAANNRENINGSQRVIKSLLSESNNLKGRTPQIFFVLSRIPFYSNVEDRPKELSIINKALNIINKEEKLIDEIDIIHSDRELEEEESFKIHQFTNKKVTNDGVHVEEDYLNLFEKITEGSLVGDEISKFNKLRESELLIEKAKNTNDNAIKIKILKDAIELNSKSLEALRLLALSYYDLESFDKALGHINKALEINAKDDLARLIMVVILKKKNELEEAEEIVNQVLEENETNLWALQALSDIYYKRKDFEKTLDINKKIILHHSDYAFGYNLVGNSYRMLGEMEKAFKYVYKCLEMEPKNAVATLTLAEIYSQIDNNDEFYKNLQLAFIFGLSEKAFKSILSEESIYKKHFKEDRFISLLKNYRIKTDTL